MESVNVTLTTLYLEPNDRDGRALCTVLGKKPNYLPFLGHSPEVKRDGCKDAGDKKGGLDDLVAEKTVE